MIQIRGYFVHEGYMGWVEHEHRYCLFATEQDYLEQVEEDDRDVSENYVTPRLRAAQA